MPSRKIHFRTKDYKLTKVGRVALPERALHRLEDVAYVLAGLVILEVEHQIDKKVYEYTAIGPDFREISPIEEPPLYFIETQNSPEGIVGYRFIEQNEITDSMKNFLESPSPEPNRADLKSRVQAKVKALVENGTYTNPEKSRRLPTSKEVVDHLADRYKF